MTGVQTCALPIYTKFFGGEDLTKVLDLEEVITGYITDIRERGMRAVVNDLALDDEKLA